MHIEYIASINTKNGINKFPTKAEVCFFGRSNVGKSSLLNAATGQKVAFISKKPGKTVSLNFYKYNNKFTIVDTPGYGFAGKSSDMSDDWTDLVSTYLDERENLKMCYLLIDSRRGLMEIDIDMMLFIEEFSVPYTLVYTKIDKLTQVEEASLLENEKLKLGTIKLENLYIPENGFMLTSSEKRTNVSKLAGHINKTLMEK